MKKKQSKGFLRAVQLVICAIAFLAVLSSLAGIYQTHFVGGGATFGTTTASLSLLAFVATIMLFLKSLRECCEE